MVDNCQLTSFPFINPNTEKDVSAVKVSNIHFHQLHFPNSSPKNTLTCFDNIFNCWNFIVKKKKCFWGSLHIYKSSSNCENFLNWSLIAPIKKYRKIPNNFQKIPVWKYKVCTVPKNTGIPGFCKNTVPYRTGIKFLIPLGPAGEYQHQGWYTIQVLTQYPQANTLSKC